MNISKIHELTKEDILALDKKGRDELLSVKKSQMKLTDATVAALVVSPTVSEEEINDRKKKDALDVTIVCNTAWLCDSHMDVLTDTSYDRSVKERGIAIPHIADHKQSSTSHVGDVKAVYTKVIPLVELGLEQEGETTALIMQSTVRKDYNEDVYKFYANGKINQHSIGLSYREMKLAINSNHENDKDYKEVWDTYYPKVINKEVVDKHGYFYVINDIDVHENSCVLFGANSLTPTLAIKSYLEIPEKEDILLTTTIGKTMTLEEAMAENIRLSTELQAIKASTSLQVAKAKVEERDRVLGILEAQKTFKLPLNAAISNIKQDMSIDQTVSMFEIIKEHTQQTNHLDTSGVLDPTINSTMNQEKGAGEFHTTLKAALDKVSSVKPLFEGVI